MSEFERGLKEGRIDAMLAEHTAHLERINGSIERFASSNEGIASELRAVQEQLRLAAERVVVAANTLATETERRRAELADSASVTDRRFSKWDRLAVLAFTAAGVALAYRTGHLR